MQDNFKQSSGQNSKITRSSINITDNAHDTIRALAMVKHEPTIKQYINSLLINEVNNLDAQDYQNFKLLFRLIKGQRSNIE